MTDRIIELEWKCSNCGSVNKGRYTQCQSCGSPKEANEQDIMPVDTTKVASVTDKEMLREANAGPNWICKYCGSSRRNLDGSCGNCDVNKDIDKVCPDDINKKTHQIAEKPDDKPKDEFDNPKNYKHRVINFIKKYYKFEIAIFVALSLVVFLIWLLVPREIAVQVKRISWSHTVELEQRFLRHGNGWKNNAPSNSFNFSCETRKRGTRNCNPYKCNEHSESYKCNPHSCNCKEVCVKNQNGYASCSDRCETCYDTCSRTVSDTCYEQCDVYEEWCSYDYHEWKVVKTKNASGEQHDEVWPSFEENNREDMREKRSSEYLVIFVDDKLKEFEYNPDDLSDFKQFETGAPWIIKVNRHGSVWPKEPLLVEKE